MPRRMLTIDEVAALMRVHRNTVYRWCRSGRLPATKVGKDWRVSRDTIEGLIAPAEENVIRGAKVVLGPEAVEPADLGGREPDGRVLEFLSSLEPGEHLLTLVDGPGAVLEVERQFFEVAQHRAGKLFKGCWWQSVDEVREQFQVGGLDVEQMEWSGRFEFADLRRIFRLRGARGAAEAWQEAAQRAVLDGHPNIWGAGSPSLDCCGGHEGLMTFEHGMDAGLRGLPVVAMCTYDAGLSVVGQVGRFIDVMAAHRSTLVLTGGRAAAFGAPRIFG